MARQKAQIGTTFIRATSRALTRGIVLLLLLTHQSWAGVFCKCTHQDKSQHTCCSAARRNETAAQMRQEGLVAHAPPHCASEEATTPDSQFKNLLQSAMKCCSAAPQSDAQGVAVPLPNPPIVKNTLPLVFINGQTPTEPAFFNVHPQRHKRPIYLSLSCLLI